MSVNKVIETARGELGVREDPPGSNRVKYWEDYDPGYQGLPWCVCFLWWCFARAGESAAFFGGGRTASCGALLRWYRERGLTVPLKEARAGDIVILDFSGRKDTQHCGLVEQVYCDAHGALESIAAIEGNTAESAFGSQDGGGCVALRQRFPAQIVAVCRPQYQPDIGDDAIGHWAEKEIRRAFERGLLRGYPDGSFRPDKPVTRAELAVVLGRMLPEGGLE